MLFESCLSVKKFLRHMLIFALPLWAAKGIHAQEVGGAGPTPLQKSGTLLAKSNQVGQSLTPAKLMRIASLLEGDSTGDQIEAFELIDQISGPNRNLIDVLRQALVRKQDIFQLEIMARL